MQVLFQLVIFELGGLFSVSTSAVVAAEAAAAFLLAAEAAAAFLPDAAAFFCLDGTFCLDALLLL